MRRRRCLSSIIYPPKPTDDIKNCDQNGKFKENDMFCEISIANGFY